MKNNNTSNFYYLYHSATKQRLIGEYSQSDLKKGDIVVATVPFAGTQGQDFIEVLCECKYKEINGEKIKIFRKANEYELGIFKENNERESEYFNRVLPIVKNSGLDIALVKVHIMPFSNELVIFYTSPNRIDFRPILPQLGKEFKMTINLRQISKKTEVKNSSEYGSCGRKLCCRSLSFADKVMVNAKMVKEQEDTINFFKMQGPCGSFFCCFSYESDFYKSRKLNFPSKGEKIMIGGESYKVKDMNYVSGIIRAESSDMRVVNISRDDIKKGEDGAWIELKKI